MGAAVLTLAILVGSQQVATADPGAGAGPGTPSQEDVDAAAAAASGAAGDVASVRAAIAVAEQRSQQAGVVAAQAAEAFNGAQLRADQAAAAATAAQAAAARADSAVAGQREVYADAIASSYMASPSLGALSAITKADGISDVLESTASMRNAEDALDTKYDDFRASATIADATESAAQRSLKAATTAAAEARSSRNDAEAASAAATAQSSAMAGQRDALINRLAQLQNVSYTLASRRQVGLERASAHSAMQAAIKEAKAKGQAAPLFDTAGASYGDPLPAIPDYIAFPMPSIPTGPAPAPGVGAAFAIAFARAQIGEPYIWAAAGPNAWDCSGLTMGAWANGGKALPHYSVAQYAASTPISPAALQPGDLVFWGKSGDPNSIYHVALYSGNGMIIQAPRAGVPVQEVSMFAWIAPNFYARP